MKRFDQMSNRPRRTPFEALQRWKKSGWLNAKVRQLRCGNYTKFEQACRELIDCDLDLWTCTPMDLEKIHGIGPKTARFFVLWTREDPGDYAALDVHILRWLREQGYDAPKQTPSGRKYRELEQAFVAEAKKQGKTPKQLDAEIWEKYSGFSERK